MKHAFTIVEILVCIAIISIVAAITTPVMKEAKHSANMQASLQKLHQLSLALSIYQMNQGEEVLYGKPSLMGLPDWDDRPILLDLPWSFYRSPCGTNPAWEDKPILDDYEYYVQTGFDKFDKIAPIFQENSVTFVDMNCADYGVPLRSDYFKHRGLGVTLGGHLLNVLKPGNYSHQSWWTTPPDSN